MAELLGPVTAALAIVAAVSVLSWGLLFLLKRSRSWWRSRFREPFHEGILRPPGWGCLERRQDALFDYASAIGALPALWAGLAYVVITGEGAIALGATLAGVPLSVFGIRHVKEAYLRARTARLGFLGECSVAEALQPLIARGWRVFHDLPMEVGSHRFNIDHVAVGPGGVWAIETKTYSRARRVTRGAQQLTVDGEWVVLPDGRRRKPLGQARGNARDLQVALNESGAAIRFVEALVVLPGWSVKYPKGASTSIRDPRNVVAFLESKERVLDDRIIARISTKLEEWCRVLQFDDQADE